jgi:hypothetical protein
MDVLAGPLSPVLTRAGLRPISDLAETVSPVPDPRYNSTPVAVLNPLLEASTTQDAVSEAAVTERPPAPLRAGVYGELAWRGWQILHQVRTYPPMAALMGRSRAVAQGVTSAVDHCADELHDRGEEMLGRIIIGVRYLPRQMAAAALAGAYTLRSLTTDTDTDTDTDERSPARTAHCAA